AAEPDDGPDAPTEAVAVAVAARLDELERLQALIVSTAAHELRSPLTVVRAHAELLAMRRDELAPHERSSVDAIVRAAGQLQEVSDGLVAELRDVAGGAEGPLRRWLGVDEDAPRAPEGQAAGGRYR
ncbi:histidine kinase dimerization/phospho-acceptor domain-containing protein, partial [Patulibacter sp. S7RM1-6]